MGMLLFLKERFPPSHAIAPVGAWVFFIVFTHAAYRFMWYVPSWLNYRSAYEILILGCYSAALSLFESLILMGFLLGLATILPSRILRDRFATQGVVIFWLLTAWAWVILNDLYPVIDRWTLAELMMYGLLGLVLIIFSIVLCSYVLLYRFKKIEGLVLAFSQRMTIFLVPYTAIGLIGLIVVAIRNIW
jgi:hypothetical protein